MKHINESILQESFSTTGFNIGGKKYTFAAIFPRTNQGEIISFNKVEEIADYLNLLTDDMDNIKKVFEKANIGDTINEADILPNSYVDRYYVRIK